MNVWMKICRKQSSCRWCPEVIEKKTYMVVTQYYRGKWKIRKNYHPDCWIAQGIAALEKKSFVESRGKQRLDITDEQRGKRFRVLARRASVLQRIRKASEEENIEDMIHLGAMLHSLREEIEPYGGAPESW